MPNIINRIYQYRPNGEWYKRPQSDIQRIVVHHSAYPGGGSDEDRLKTMMTWHTNQGWPGLSYHFVICKSGNIYQINNFEDITWTDYQNRNSLAILVDGYFHSPKFEEPTKEQLSSLKELLDWLCTENPQFPAGNNREQDVVGHRDISAIFSRPDWATACPGDNLYKYVKKYAEIGKIIDSGITTNNEDMLKNKTFDLIKKLKDGVQYNWAYDNWGRALGNTENASIGTEDLVWIAELIDQCGWKLQEKDSLINQHKVDNDALAQTLEKTRRALSVAEVKIKELEAKPPIEVIKEVPVEVPYNSSTKPFFDSKKVKMTVIAIIAGFLPYAPVIEGVLPDNVKSFWLLFVGAINGFYQIAQGQVDKANLSI